MSVNKLFCGQHFIFVTTLDILYVLNYFKVFIGNTMLQYAGLRHNKSSLFYYFFYFSLFRVQFLALRPAFLTVTGLWLLMIALAFLIAA